MIVKDHTCMEKSLKDPVTLQCIKIDEQIKELHVNGAF